MRNFGYKSSLGGRLLLAIGVIVFSFPAVCWCAGLGKAWPAVSLPGVLAAQVISRMRDNRKQKDPFPDFLCIAMPSGNCTAMEGNCQ